MVLYGNGIPRKRVSVKREGMQSREDGQETCHRSLRLNRI